MNKFVHPAPMLMFAEVRRRKILELLEGNSSVRVADLSVLFQTSPISVRRDLKELERAGLLRRAHGGAISRDAAAFEPSVEEKDQRLKAEKAAIARAAAGLIEEGDTVMLDAGTTTAGIARLLKQRKNITVVTNAINIAQELAGSDLEILLIGGLLRGKTLSMVGPLAERALAEFHADKVFLATNGVDLRMGLTTPNVAEAQTKRAMVESAREVIVVADHSKAGRIAFRKFCGLERVHCLITDAGTPADFRRALEQRGVKVLVASAGRENAA